MEVANIVSAGCLVAIVGFLGFLVGVAATNLGKQAEALEEIRAIRKLLEERK